jgi:hypothetical protein
LFVSKNLSTGGHFVDACAEIAECTTENKVLLSEMHRLGVAAPSHDVFGSIACWR